MGFINKNTVIDCDIKYRTLIELAKNRMYKDSNGVYVRYKRNKYYLIKDEYTEKIHFTTNSK